MSKEKALNKNLILLAEKYPKLNANNNFKDFMSRLSQIEENIAYYRGFYNKTVLKYNTLIAIFPFNLIAKIGKFKQAEFWKNE